MLLTITAKISATTIESHKPSNSRINGKVNIITIWNTSVLKNDIAADTNPLFKAVKNDDAKIFNPLIKYDNENNLIALVVNSSNSML